MKCLVLTVPSEMPRCVMESDFVAASSDMVYSGR